MMENKEDIMQHDRDWGVVPWFLMLVLSGIIYYVRVLGFLPGTIFRFWAVPFIIIAGIGLLHSLRTDHKKRWLQASVVIFVLCVSFLLDEFSILPLPSAVLPLMFFLLGFLIIGRKAMSLTEV
jgi:hypothetical protein